MSTSGGVPFKHEQSAEMKANGITYLVSGGSYAYVYCPSNGLLIADENCSPEAISKHFKEQGLPYVKLKQWSDVVFLNWQQECSAAGTSLSGLQAVIRLHCEHRRGDVIAQVTGGQTIGGYKNPIVFEPGESNFNALLGTPNGSGVA
ncbi:uncharacterized protein Aud_001707 [Aspergillus udagawae]|uniref:Uncharacterized protein n=1 Tax=Aspergillus udagawae TaxID=91492 RepID=A0A8E0QKU8_9EURO|nr:uncharacterized protein Aud_001707 [Aspergillus udagawae]GIC85867.1 hypothetical protein Aud_001707 [Aspergillus udagawae]